MEGSTDEGTQQEAVETSPNGGEPPMQQHPSILVVRVPGPNPGEEQIQIAELNGIDPLSTPTVLRIAANIRQHQLGLE